VCRRHDVFVGPVIDNDVFDHILSRFFSWGDGPISAFAERCRLIPESKITEIRERADIAEVVGDYVTLRRAGANMKGVCPFHADTDPSFNVSPGRQFFHCFGCGASGDVFSFLQRVEGLEFMDAARRLAERYSVELPEREMEPAARSAEERARAAAKRRMGILESAAKFYEAELTSDRGARAREFLGRRGVTMETAAAFRLGSAPDSWDALLEHMRRHGVSPREVEDVGLALPRKSGDGHYDRFRNRLMFTITDPFGHPIAFSGRIFDGATEADGAKYINSPETAEYRKGKVLFGLHLARVPLSKLGEAILVEGNFDVVSMAQAGIANVVAPLGTALTEEQAVLLRRRVERVVVMFDGDSAGRAASARAFPILARAGLASYIAVLPPGEDPDSLARKGGALAVGKALAAREGLLDRIIVDAAHASDGTAQDKARRIAALFPLLDAVRSPMERDLYRQRVAAAFGLDERTVFRHLRAGPETESPREEPQAGRLPGTKAERGLVGLLIDRPELFEQALCEGTLGLVTSPEMRVLVDELTSRYRRKETLFGDFVADATAGPALAWLAERAMTTLHGDTEKAAQALADITADLRSTSVYESISKLKEQIEKASESGDDAHALELMKAKTALEQKLPQHAPYVA
jgi:DNA primase